MQLKHRSSNALTGAEAMQGGDYVLVQKAIAFLVTARDGQGLASDVASGLANHLNVSAAHLGEVLGRWCGLSPRSFAEALTPGHIRGLLSASGGVLADRNGGRPVHPFDVKVISTITDDAQRRGTGLEITYGVHACPFGQALLTMTEGGLCGLAFADADAGESRRAALDDMIGRWPRARFREAPRETSRFSARIFGPFDRDVGDGVPLTLIGTQFDLNVWQALLRIPMGALVSYTEIARYLGQPTASRAVGTANGRNPISFLVPCHRALRSDGTLGGYYWGLGRKRALIAWETGRAQAVKSGQFRN
jgi:AraC family transcriptional regulator of adaptative response/methylated-DNA-[protein]-cysteine methyltransferase